ncbi:nicotinate-nucleotide adenylyltransferase [Leucothrix mucor]|uniref:nicotinate-nucleotide adenylyltransferase n=1 Tax=Leucothrix mucor TaxID=45248 RepID=UPI0003B7B868|nr:nicotinate-nucleotide adenylyltransferase [Leucothrix mucor]
MIGVRGGTFDPIHTAHLRATQEVAEALSLSQVRFIPGKLPPHRSQPDATADQRLAMVELAIASNERFIADDRELRREGYSYTVDTLRSLRHELGESEPLVLILGLDAFQGFTSWHEWEAITTLAHLAVTSRPDYTAQPLQAWAQAMQTDNAEELRNSPASKLFFTDTTALAISATDIRHQQQEQRSIRYLLPDAVYDYIQHQNLYRK